MNLKEAMKRKLTSKELELMPRSFDTIGTIAVLEIPRELVKKEKLIANEVLKRTSLKGVFKKSGKISGKLRTRKLKWLAGEKTKETTHVEAGCKFRLNVETCYFSPRLSNDRLTVARHVKLGEKVLCLFSGVGPYPIVIAKNSKAEKVYGIELNKVAAKYADMNVKLNKLKNVELIQGDVKNALPKLIKKVGKFDRIMMSRPRLDEDFLVEAFSAAKDGTIIHFHDFLKGEDIPSVAYRKIEDATAKLKKHPKHYKIIKWQKAGDIGPRRYRIRVDFRVF